jgi:hypothetical protein
MLSMAAGRAAMGGNIPPHGQVSADARLGVMRRLAVILMLALPIGCTGGEDGDDRARPVERPSKNDSASQGERSVERPSKNDSASQEKGREPTLKNPAKALLTIQDMPRGWTTDEAVKSSGHFCERRIPAASDPIKEVRAAFGKDKRLGPWITHAVFVHEEGDAAERLDFYAKAAEACPTRAEVPGSAVTYTVKRLFFPRFGDETVAYRIIRYGKGYFYGEGFKTEGDYIRWRRGDVHVLVIHEANELFFNSTKTEQFVGKADGKLVKAGN